MAKLLENIFRNVNIAFVNQLALLCERMGLDVWEVIDAAATKPFGFMRFTPGPGVGGHCIPVDPYYLRWRAREFDFIDRFIELAGDINFAMPRHVVDLVAEALNDRGKAAQGRPGRRPRASRSSPTSRTRATRRPATSSPGIVERGAERPLPRPAIVPTFRDDGRRRAHGASAWTRCSLGRTSSWSSRPTGRSTGTASTTGPTSSSTPSTARAAARSGRARCCASARAGRPARRCRRSSRRGCPWPRRAGAARHRTPRAPRRSPPRARAWPVAECSRWIATTSAGSPSATIRPCSSRIARLQNSMTQFMSWVTKTTPLAAVGRARARGPWTCARNTWSPVARTSSSSRMSGSTDGRDARTRAARACPTSRS